MGVGRADDLRRRPAGRRDVLAAEVEPVGKPVDLKRDPASRARHRTRLFEVEGVLGPTADQSPGGMAEAAAQPGA